VFVVSLAACAAPPPAVSPAVFVSSNTNVAIDPSPDPMAPPPPPPAPPPPPMAAPAWRSAPAPVAAPAWRRVQVLVDKRIPRPTEVLTVFDFHTDATSEDKGFDELRARAAAIGADAVIGAEFEHGEGDEPSHLSGMAVRFLDY
jgi:hypothetical protein